MQSIEGIHVHISAIAAELVKGLNIHDSVAIAKQYVFESLKSAQKNTLGKGKGPLLHSVKFTPSWKVFY